jgi:KaiC/GvpD/RAD55 family RecA-like ATPase
VKTHASHAVVTKLLTCIGGFDEITGGGIPRHRTTLVTGGRGSEKTVSALQSLVYGATRNGEPGLFVAKAMMRKLRHADDEVALALEQLLSPRTRADRKSQNGDTL